MDRRWKQILPRLALLALLGAILGMVAWRGTPCLIRQFTGVICPTCGMTRAWRACFRLELLVAFSYHPMFWIIPVLALAFLLDGFAFPGKKATHVIYWVTLLGFAATWMIRILCSLCGVQTV